MGVYQAQELECEFAAVLGSFEPESASLEFDFLQAFCEVLSLLAGSCVVESEELCSKVEFNLLEFLVSFGEGCVACVEEVQGEFEFCEH